MAHPVEISCSKRTKGINDSCRHSGYRIANHFCFYGCFAAEIISTAGVRCLADRTLGSHFRVPDSGALQRDRQGVGGVSMKGVFVVGAGPAGMFAARQIALAGYETFIFNRDIRPGGLAQYGIYPLKNKMKTGLRKQFDQTLALPNVHYFGHVQVGAAYDISLAELESFRPAAIVFASGAQGAKRLGLPGEDALGVYASKDFVYNYNQLESHVTRDFSSYRRIAVIGVGNVAIDVARWLLLDKPEGQTESVVIVARRGPLEVKFDKKEIEHVEPFISRADLVAELERVKDRCAA